MAILTATTIQPRSGDVLDDLQKLLKRIKDMETGKLATWQTYAAQTLDL
jgi:hypothetical protein